MVDANLVKLAIDGYKGHVAGNYSVSDAQETLRAALVEANGGKTSFDIKDVRAGRCEKVFTIVEELVNAISEEGLRGDEFFMNMVEDRNMALSDTPVFHIERDSLLAVADIAEGTQGVRRQRIEGGTDITVTTQLHAVKIYEELNRVLSGRIDFNKLVDSVSRSFVKNELDSAYAAFTGMFNKLQAPYSESGSYDEEKLLTLVEHVEAATGQTAMIVGTKKALRKVTTAVVSDSAKEDLYNMGYYGKVAGIPMVAVKQRHEAGSNKFILDDKNLYIFAGDSKPIKRVTKGDVVMLTGNPMTNADLTQEFLMAKRTGIAIVMDRDYGIYKMS